VHLRVAGGPRVEETERQVAAIERIIRGDPEANVPGVVAADDLEMILSNVGLSSRWSAIYSPNNGPHAAAIRVQLRSGFAGRRTSTLEYVDRLRTRLTDEFPATDFFFESGGMIRRVLNAGAVAPIEVQVRGRDNEVRRDFARRLNSRLSRLAHIQDTYLPQGMALPQIVIQVDRNQAAQQFGFTDLDVMRSVFTALMSSAQIAPNLWIDRQSGNHYLIGVQYPEDEVRTIQSLEDIPISSDRNRPGSGNVRKLKEMARIERTQGPLEIYRHTGEPVSQLFLNIVGNDLRVAETTVREQAGRMLLDYALANLPDGYRWLADDGAFKARLEKYLRDGRKTDRGAVVKKYGIDPESLKRGIRVEVKGEVASMSDSLEEMAWALGLAVLLVYLIMVAQFSSWLDPLVMIVAAPLGLIGVAITLRLTNSSLNIQSAMGVLMMIGISVSNSVLLIEFANRERRNGRVTVDAVLSAARVRLRPILMTTIATVAGLLPMAVHLRPGDEMNLPLARAVIGGLAGSTVLTLFVVPVLFVLVKPRGDAIPVGEPL
jgi:multidrug efflux pump subunit AcrB